VKVARYRDAAVHELKTQPEPFNAVLANVKPYEVRNNLDRRFEVGDHLVLREWIPNPSIAEVMGAPSGRYTGRVAYRTIGYITRGGTWGLPTDLDVLGFESQPWVPR
jgi:hypothetical protein